MRQVLRYLVPLVTLVVLLGRSVSAFAAAGPQVDVTCCCPDPSACKCHHGEGGGGESSIKRCDGGEHFVSPELELASLPIVFETTVVPERPRAVIYLLAALSDAHAIVPEKPPF